MTDAISIIVNLLDANWSKSPKPSIEDIANLDRGDGKRVRLQDKDVIRIFETAHNEAQPELLYDFVNEHINLTLDIRTVKSRERLSVLRNEVRRILHGFRKGDNKNIDRIIFKTRTDLSDRSKKLFRYTMQCEVVTFSLTAGSESTFINPETNQVSGADVFQSLSTTLTEISQLTPTNNFVIVGNGNNWVTQEMGDITAVVAGTGLSGGGTAGSVTLNVSGVTLSELAANSLQLSSESFVDNDTTIMTSAAILDKIQAELSAFTSGVDLTGGNGVLIQNELNTGSGDYSATIALDLKDEDDMASNSATHAASQQSIKAYVDSEISGLIDSAPGALDTLNELAAAINDDSSFATTITTSIATKLAKASNLSDLTNAGTARTNLGLGTLAVESVANPSDHRIITSTGSGSGLNAEADLTFDGTSLTISNTQTSDGVVADIAFRNATDSIGAIQMHRVSNNSQADMSFHTQPNGGSVTERMRIISSGRVGLGTTTPATLLHLKGSGSEAMPLRLHRPTEGGNNYGVGLEFVMGETGDASVERVYGEVAMAMDGASGNAAGGNAHDGYFTIRPSFNGLPTERVRVTSDGKVGIGTTSPATALDVSGIIQGQQFRFNSNLRIGNPAANQIAIFTAATERVRFDASGNVGIGTTSPAVPFHVEGGNNEAARFLGSGNDAFIKVQEPTDAYNVVLGSTGGTGFVGSASNNNFAIRANNSNKVIITPAGNVGIGQLSPSTALDVSGTVTATAFSGPLTGNVTGNASTATALQTARNIHGVSFDGTANIDLSEVIQDTVGAMFSSNTESGITVTYQDADGTIDLAVANQLTLLDEDDFASNSATAPASQQSIKAYVDNEVSSLVDSAPAALNTLNELAAALGDDASFSTTTATALGNRLRVDVSNQGLTGTQQSNALTNLGITATLAEINILDDGLSASDIPNLATSKITSGTFANGRISEGSVTQHQAALSITESQISDFGTYLTAPRTVTAGGNTLANGETLAFTAGSNVTITESGGAVTIASTDTNTQLTTEQVQDIVGAMVDGGTETNISVTYDDTGGKLNFVSTDTNTQLTTEQVQDIVGAMVDGGTETNIAVTYDDTGGKLNFVSTDTNTQLTNEQVQDIVGAMFTGNTETNITATYQDSDGTIDLAVGAGAGISSTDDVSEGSSNLYFTDERVDDRVNALLTAGSNVSLTYDDASNTLTLASTDTNTQLSQEQVEDFVGGMLDGTETFISVSYDDTDGNIDFVVPVKNENDMLSNSSSHLATQSSIKAYIDGKTASLVDSAPAALDTLNELAAALNDDASFSTTTATALGNRLRVDDTQSLTNTQKAQGRANLGVDVAGTDNSTNVTLVTSSHDYLSISGQAITLGAIDISDDTNLVAGTGISLSGDTLNVGGLTVSELAAGSIQLSSESFVDNDTSLMTSAAINDRIESFGYTTNTGDITSVVAGTGLSGGATSGAATVNLDISGLTAEATIADDDLVAIYDTSANALRKMTKANFVSGLSGGGGSVRTVTAGGNTLAEGETLAFTAGSNITISESGGAVTIASTDTNTQLSTEQVQDIVGAMFSSNTETRISATYQDGDGTIDLVVDDMTADTNTFRTVTAGGNTLGGSETLAFTAGSNITITESGGAVTIASTDTNTQLSQEQVEDFVAGVIVAGSNITKTYDDAAGTLTLASTDTNTQLSTEQVQDIVGAMFSSNTETRISATYQDGDGTIDLVVDDMTANTQLSTEQVQDIVGAMVSSNTETNISVTYDDTNGKLDFVSTDTNTQLTLLDEDNMSSNSATAAASQQSIKAYVDAEVAGLVDSAPTALNTLNELAAALGDDANFATTTSTSLGNRLRVDVNNQGLTSTQQGNALTNLGITASLAEINILESGLSASDIPNLAASKITSGTLGTARIPNLATSKITSGTFANGRISEGSVTQHQAALSITESQISDLQSYLTAPRTITAGGNTLANGETLAFTAGSNVTITESGGAVTIAATDTNTQYSAGTLLDLSSTTFNVDLSEASEAAVAVADDYFLFLDGGATGTAKKEAIADFVAAIAGSNISASNGQLSSLFPSAGTLLDLSGTTLNVDLSEASETAVAVADDYILFLDGGATGATKKESIADLVAAMAGTNLTASNGVLSAAASGEANQNAFSTVAVSGQTNVAADSATDTLTFAAGSNVTITTNASNDTVTIAATDTNTQLSTEQVQDIVGAMFSSNTETRISATYQDGDGTIDLVVDDMTADTNTFRTVTAGGNTLGASETLAFTAGSNVTISESGGAVTIASTDTNTQLSTEQVQDIVGGMFSGNTETGITATYQDGDGTIDLVIGTLNQNTSGNAATATLASTVTVSDSTANTNFPVVFHDESNALLDDTGALRYNPSTGTLLVPNLSVSGTTTQVDTVTMEAANAIVFEGATANNFETTLTITDPTADRTITLPDTTGTVALTSDIPTNNNQLTNGAGYTTNVGDITGVTAGTGLSGGGSSGAVTLNVDLPGLSGVGESINDSDSIFIYNDSISSLRKTTFGGTNSIASWIQSNVSKIRIRDARNEGATTSSEVLPNEFDDKAVNFTFTDDVANSTNAWDSVITMKGWSDNYRVWQLFSASDSSSNSVDTEPLYFRSGEGDVNSGNWGARREILTFPGTTPNADGSANQVLVTDGNGALTWANQTDTNTQLSTEQVQDIVGAMFSSNTETRISATYQDGDGTIDLVVDDMTADTNTQLSNEQVQDIVGAMVSSNTETNISVTYDDANGKLNFASTDTNTTYSAGNGLALSGTTFKINDPVNLSQLTESTDATTDKILLWDESASLWKYMTLDDLQDSIDTTGGSGTTINNNADNRIITGSGTANTLNAEGNLTWDGNTLIVSGGTGDAVLSLRADSDNSGELDQPYIEFVLDGTTTHSSIGHSSDVFHNDSTDNNTLIIANSVATNASGSGIVLATGQTAGHENAVEAMRIGPDRKISFNNEYTFPLTDGSANQVLQTNGSGVLSFATVSSGGGSSTTGGSKPVVYMDSGNTNVSTTETTIPFDTEVLDPSGNATLSTALGGDGTIRLAAAGYYEISYSIPINDDSSSFSDRTRVFAFMQTDDNENWTSPTTVAQSRSQVYTREASGGSGLSASFIYEHTANDYIRIRIDAQNNTDISTETNQSQISIRLLSTAQDDAFTIVGEESDDYITSEAAAGNANGFSFSYGNGAQNTTKSSSGSDFGVVVPFDSTLHRIDITFGNKGSETNSSNQTLTVFKNFSASTTTMTYNASGTSGNAFVRSFTSLSGNGLSYSAGDTFNLRATGLAGYGDTQVGPARMTATFLRTQ